MMNNEKTVNVKIKRKQLCDLILACTVLDSESGYETKKWRELRDQLKKILNDFDFDLK